MKTTLNNDEQILIFYIDNTILNPNHGLLFMPFDKNTFTWRIKYKKISKINLLLLNHFIDKKIQISGIKRLEKNYSNKISTIFLSRLIFYTNLDAKTFIKILETYSFTLKRVYQDLKQLRKNKSNNNNFLEIFSILNKQINLENSKKYIKNMKTKEQNKKINEIISKRNAFRQELAELLKKHSATIGVDVDYDEDENINSIQLDFDIRYNNNSYDTDCKLHFDKNLIFDNEVDYKSILNTIEN